MWTRFFDMHSGGGRKEDFEYLYIEADIKTAKIIFYNRFGHNPERVTCTCCGEDYSITEYNSLEEATAYERQCRFVNNKYDFSTGMSIEDLEKEKQVLILRDRDIKPEEKIGELPTQGYVWLN